MTLLQDFLAQIALSRRNCIGAGQKNFAETSFGMMTKEHLAQNRHEILSGPIFLGFEKKLGKNHEVVGDPITAFENLHSGKKIHKNQNFQKKIFLTFYLVTGPQHSQRRGL